MSDGAGMCGTRQVAELAKSFDFRSPGSGTRQEFRVLRIRVARSESLRDFRYVPRGKKDNPSRSVSRVLSRAGFGPPTFISPGRALPRASSGLPESHDVANHDGAARTPPCSLHGLAPDGVYRAATVTRRAGKLLPYRFTLATRLAVANPFGGLLSVALSLVSRPVCVTDHPVLRSPDCPLVAVDGAEQVPRRARLQRAVPATSEHPIDSDFFPKCHCGGTIVAELM